MFREMHGRRKAKLEDKLGLALDGYLPTTFSSDSGMHVTIVQ